MEFPRNGVLSSFAANEMRRHLLEDKTNLQKKATTVDLIKFTIVSLGIDRYA
jgi:hypothetical protein